jgi:glycine oxidase
MEREAGFSTTSTAGGVQDILRRAELMLPAVLDLPIVQLSAGLRPTGPNRQPVLGHTELPGLIFASGGHSYGILLTPIIAESISQLVLDGQINPLIAQFVR